MNTTTKTAKRAGLAAALVAAAAMFGTVAIAEGLAETQIVADPAKPTPTPPPTHKHLANPKYNDFQTS